MKTITKLFILSFILLASLKSFSKSIICYGTGASCSIEHCFITNSNVDCDNYGNAIPGGCDMTYCLSGIKIGLFRDEEIEYYIDEQNRVVLVKGEADTTYLGDLDEIYGSSNWTIMWEVDGDCIRIYFYDLTYDENEKLKLEYKDEVLLCPEARLFNSESISIETHENSILVKSNFEIKQYEIFNTLGALVKKGEKINKNSFISDNLTLSNGVYIMRVTSMDNSILTKKIYIAKN